MPIKITPHEDIPALNLTSMIDILFLLIIFFMIGTKFVESERQIDTRSLLCVDNPRGALTVPPDKKLVNIYRDGQVELDHPGRHAAATHRSIDRLCEWPISPAGRPGPRRRQRAAAASGRRPVLACQAGVADLGISVRMAGSERNSCTAVSPYLLLAFEFDVQLLRVVVWVGPGRADRLAAGADAHPLGPVAPVGKCIVLSLLGAICCWASTRPPSISSASESAGRRRSAARCTVGDGPEDDRSAVAAQSEIGRASHGLDQRRCPPLAQRFWPATGSSAERQRSLADATNFRRRIARGDCRVAPRGQCGCQSQRC